MAITKNATIAAPLAPDWASLRHAQPGDVAAIQNIYQEVYRGTYTYQEYTDALYLNTDMTGGHSGWYVVEDATRGKEIAGCVSIGCNKSMKDRIARDQARKARKERSHNGLF